MFSRFSTEREAGGDAAQTGVWRGFVAAFRGGSLGLRGDAGPVEIVTE